MKILASLLCVLSCAVATAMPKIGDYTTMSVVIEGVAGSTVETEITKFDPTTNKFLEVTTQNILGEKSSSQEWAEVYTEAQLTDVLANCAKNGGVLSDVTVKAGTFSTCALAVSSPGITGTVWIGIVPYGVVKANVVNNGYSVQEELDSYKLGQ